MAAVDVDAEWADAEAAWAEAEAECDAAATASVYVEQPAPKRQRLSLRAGRVSKVTSSPAKPNVDRHHRAQSNSSDVAAENMSRMQLTSARSAELLQNEFATSETTTSKTLEKRNQSSRRGLNQCQEIGRESRSDAVSRTTAIPLPHVPLNVAYTDVRGAELKPDHALRPLWVCPDGRIFLERFNRYYEKACDFLAVVAEPVCRPRFIHEYRLTEHSLYAAVAVGLDTASIIGVLGKLSKVLLLSSLTEWITDCTMSFGKAKLVLRENCHWIECSSREVMAELLTDEEIEAARDPNPPTGRSTAGSVAAGAGSSTTESTAAGGDNSSASQSSTPNDASPDESGIDDDALNQMMEDWEAVSGTDYDPRRNQQQQQQQQKQKQKQKKKSENNAAASIDTTVKSDHSVTSLNTANASGHQVGKSVSLQNDDAEYLEALANGSVSELGDIVAPWEVAANSSGEQIFKFALRSGLAESVKQRCIERQTPLLEEYDFRHDSRNPPLQIESKPMVHLRDYQEKSLKQMFSTGCARSGVIVLPCGAGKTLTGLMAAVTIKKATLVLCVNTMSVEQWREHFNTNTTIDFKDTHVLTSERRPPHNFLASGTVDKPARGAVVITTYPMITYSGRRNEVSDRAINQIRNTEWGLLILDEVHQVPARTFRRVLSTCKAHCKLGLTATLVREDERISDLQFLIGPKLYEANWLDLAAAGHLARVQCTEMWTPMTPEFYSEYLRADGLGTENSPMPWRRQLLYSMNPNKIRTCSYLIDFHEAKYDKILVFCDNLYCLKRYAGIMKRPYICGSVKQSDRARLLEQFKTSDEVNCLFISRVGDTAIDLPAATVIIQIACTDGSRRQEAQRLGRILRPKDRQVDSTEPNAFFYSLVSRDTDEVFYAAKRQSFLVDQGYSFKVLPAAAALADAPGLPFESRQSQLQLLAEVLACGEAEDLEDELTFPTTLAASKGATASSAAAASAASAASNALAPVRRTTGSLSELSGAAGLAYQEFTVDNRDAVRQGLQRHVPTSR